MDLFDGFEVILPDKLNDYYKPGVWAMFGIPVSEEKGYVCLNVGKNNCIGKELERDYKCLREFPKVSEKVYANQFNRLKFRYPQHPTRLDYLYSEIYKKFKEITTILITDEAENTYTVEKYFAYTTEAEYWVSNGRYNSKTDVDTKKIKEGIDTSIIDSKLIKKIDEFGEKYTKQKPVVRKEELR